MEELKAQTVKVEQKAETAPEAKDGGTNDTQNPNATKKDSIASQVALNESSQLAQPAKPSAAKKPSKFARGFQAA